MLSSSFQQLNKKAKLHPRIDRFFIVDLCVRYIVAKYLTGHCCATWPSLSNRNIALWHCCRLYPFFPCFILPLFVPILFTTSDCFFRAPSPHSIFAHRYRTLLIGRLVWLLTQATVVNKLKIDFPFIQIGSILLLLLLGTALPSIHIHKGFCCCSFFLSLSLILAMSF